MTSLIGHGQTSNPPKSYVPSGRRHQHQWQPTEPAGDRLGWPPEVPAGTNSGGGSASNTLVQLHWPVTGGHGNVVGQIPVYHGSSVLVWWPKVWGPTGGGSRNIMIQPAGGSPTGGSSIKPQGNPPAPNYGSPATCPGTFTPDGVGEALS